MWRLQKHYLQSWRLLTAVHFSIVFHQNYLCHMVESAYIMPTWCYFSLAFDNVRQSMVRWPGYQKVHLSWALSSEGWSKEEGKVGSRISLLSHLFYWPRWQSWACASDHPLLWDALSFLVLPFPSQLLTPFNSLNSPHPPVSPWLSEAAELLSLTLKFSCSH